MASEQQPDDDPVAGPSTTTCQRDPSIPPPLFSDAHIFDEEVPYSVAEELASISGMPFGQAGYGTSLTVGEVRTPSQGQPESFAARTGGKRKKAGAAARGPKVNAARATVAYPRLSTNATFVSRLRSDLDRLVDSCVQQWATMKDTTLMYVVESQWRALGWAYVHVAVGEDLRTRKSFYDGITRDLVRRLALYLPTEPPTNTDTDAPDKVLRACITLFILYIYWATAPPVVDETVMNVMDPPGLAPYRPVPGIVPQQGLQDKAKSTFDAFRQLIGRAWPIQIEADVLARLGPLTDLAHGSLDIPLAQNDVPTSEQVNAVLYTFSHHVARQPAAPRTPKSTPKRGAKTAASDTQSDCETETESDDQRHDEGQNDTQDVPTCSAWSILPPTSSGPSRYPLFVPDNWICTRAESDVQRKRWGCMTVAPPPTAPIPTSNHNTTTAPVTQVPLSRAQRSRAVLVQHLESENFWPTDSNAQRSNQLLDVDLISTVGFRGNVPRTSLRLPDQAASIPASAELPEFNLSEREPLQMNEDLDTGTIRLPGDPVPDAPRVLHHAVPRAVGGVASLETLARFTHSGEEDRADQIRGVTGLVRDVLRSSNGQQPSAEQSRMASELGMPSLANLLVAASQEVERPH